MELSAFCIQLLYFAQIAIAIPQPLNAAAPIALSPSTSDNVTSLGRGVSPPIPPGFATTTQSINGNELNPYDAHMAVITFMELRKSFDWTENAQNVEWRYRSARFQTPVKIAIAVSKTDFRTPPMTNGHVMLALRDGIHAMKRTGVLWGTPLIGVNVVVTLFGRPVGRVSLSRTKYYSEIRSIPSDITMHLSTHDSAGNQTSTVSDFPAEGRFTDPRFPGVSIQYRLHGEKDTIFKIFGCIMEAMIILAYDGNYILFDKLAAKDTGKIDAYGKINTFELEMRAVAPRNPHMGLISSSMLMVAELYLKTIENWWSNSKVATLNFAVELESPGSRPTVQAQGLFKIIYFRPLTANGSITTA